MVVGMLVDDQKEVSISTGRILHGATQIDMYPF